jgi:transcriptional regulator of heat shock response
LKDDYIYPNKKQIRIKLIQEIQIPDHKTVLNFILSDDTKSSESYLQSKTKSNELEEFKRALNQN